MERPERVYSREQLLDLVWGHGVYVEGRTVDVHMSRLRRALSQSPDGEPPRPDIVRTVRGTGYGLSRPAK
jgi:two-component system phosphate regulon response regulator PhoB